MLNTNNLTVGSLVEISANNVTTLINVREGIPRITMANNDGTEIPSFIALLSCVEKVNSSFNPKDLRINYKKFLRNFSNLFSIITRENSQLSKMSIVFLLYSAFNTEYYRYFKYLSGEFIEFVPLSGPRELIGKRFIEYIDFKHDINQQLNSSEILKCNDIVSRMINRSDIRVIS